MAKIKAVSLFASAGIGELLLEQTNIEVIAANELLAKRADCYRHFYPSARMYCGDITEQTVKEAMIAECNNNKVKLLLATPPCQGLSTLGKNKYQLHYEKDRRNFLILHVLDIIDACDFDYILIENVPRFIEMHFPYQEQYLCLQEILEKKYASRYTVEVRVLNAKDYGIAQSRPRAIIKLYKPGLHWGWPTAQEEIPLSKAIGHLPSLESGEESGIAWHFSKPHSDRIVLALRHTPTGKSAIANEVYYPKKEDGTRIKGFHNTFKRMDWDKPSPARTTFSGSMSSHNNVHPGRLLPDGTYSDARVLTLLETFIVSSLPEQVDFPKDATDTFIRTMIGEAIPPLLMKKVVETIGGRVCMPTMVERNKWILYKHTCSYEMIKAVALDVKNSCKTNISDVERHRMQERLAALNLYATRSPGRRPLDAINHRINTLEFWMFGYESKMNGAKKFMFSPLGNLFLKHIDNAEGLKKIFVAMLFAMQFQHPGSGTHREFQLYPFRLIFLLLLDKRLGGKLYNHEVEYLLVFVKSIAHDSYEQLVQEILDIRDIAPDAMAARFKADEHTYVNAVYEWEYYTQTLLAQVGLINRLPGAVVCKLYHPSRPNSTSAPTGRTATLGAIELSEEISPFVAQMLDSYSCFDAPIRLDDPERMTADCIKEIYSFYPQLLLQELGEADELSALLELPKLIERYADNPDNDTAYLFEEVLTQGFNLFAAVEAQRRGGAAHTDIECLYIPRKKKFAVESKSTANKLLGINAGRLREHREEIGGEYTIVVTPRYVPATKRDIIGTPIVIILASTFAEYLYNHIFHDVRDMDYEDFDSLIENNLGTDISKLISNLTVERFAANG